MDRNKFIALIVGVALVAALTGAVAGVLALRLTGPPTVAQAGRDAAHAGETDSHSSASGRREQSEGHDAHAAHGNERTHKARDTGHKGERHSGDRSGRHDGADPAEEKGGGHEGHDASGGEHAGHVRLSDSQLKQLDLKVKELEAGSAQSVLERPASVMWDLDRVAQVGPRITAKVEKVLVDLGENVKKGQPVAVMSSVELGRAKANFLSARARVGSAAARLETDRANYERLRKLHEQQISSEAAMLEARAKKGEAQAKVREAKADLNAAREKLRVLGLTEEAIANVEAGTDQPLSFFKVRSPKAGVVQKRHISVGNTVGAQETPIHVVETSRMWVMVEAYERDVPLLATGKKVELRVRSLPERTFTGKVDWISNELGEDTRTVRVRAVVKNADGALKAGMFGRAGIRTNADDGKAALAPVDAIQRVGKKPVVFVPGDRPGVFRRVRVTLGQESADAVELLSGVEPGQKVVVRGAFDLKSAFTAKGRSAAHSH